MALDIKGKNVKLWVNEHDGRNGGKFYTYAVSVSRKGADGNYVNKSVRLVAGRDVTIPDGLISGTSVDFEGFLTLNLYTDKDGVDRSDISIFATSIHFNDFEYGGTEQLAMAEDSFANVEDDIPF